MKFPLPAERYRIRVRGIVQGVGFRPFIYGLALRYACTGYVSNTSDGVFIEIEGESVHGFLDALKNEPPPLARIYSIDTENLPPAGYRDFQIRESAEEGSFTHVSPDVSVCDDCLRELFDPSDRRYLYPFINCTNCGPRYSITKKVPYDRKNTTMSVFDLCPECSSEYHDPLNRRFHAQPNACPVCGPKVSFSLCAGEFTLSHADPVVNAIGIIRQGGIVAVRGIGGFHLCCDPLNASAVERLRVRKKRINKPFALMAGDVVSIEQFCLMTGDEKTLLLDRKRPIVLLAKKPDNGLPEGIAPQNRSLGFMLPCSPLHYLLFFHPDANRERQLNQNHSDPLFPALVMTSGNVSEEPIVTSNEEAFGRLDGIADAFLVHDRDIFMRVDDSVTRAGENGSFLSVRRSRGYVPGAVDLREDGPEILACGADLKNTFTIAKSRFAIVSQHIGDLENLETVRFFEETIENLTDVYRLRPESIVHDLHPEYHSTRWALRYADARNLPVCSVQHHHAHIASVMAEHDVRECVIGVALDGTGYGTDGTLWGGEFLVCDRMGFDRAAHLRPVPLPGGERAIREGWRSAIGYIALAYGEEAPGILARLGFAYRYGDAAVNNVLSICRNPRFSPLSSGAGRLFDAVSAIAGIRDRNSFEGEAAIALESCLGAAGTGAPYPYAISERQPAVLDWRPLVMALTEDVLRKSPVEKISASFHRTVIMMTRDAVRLIGEKTGIRTVALSGGVFQNEAVIGGVRDALDADGFGVLLHRHIPCNDGCISLGQAVVARERIRLSLET